MINEYITYLRDVRGYSPNTCKAYRYDVVTFVVWIKQQRTEVRWSNITRDDVDAYVIERSKAGLKASTTNRALASISGIYNYMKRQGYEVANPCRYESRRKIGESVPNTIPCEDLRNAYEHSYGVAKVIIGILATTGIRVQELLNMTWESIDFEKCSIHIYGKGQKERVVYTSPEYLETLRISAAQEPKSGRVITMEQREVRWLLWNALRPWSNAKQLSPHAIRHTMATQAAAHGANVTTLAVALGHKNIRTTQKYIDLGAAETRELFTQHNMLH